MPCLSTTITNHYLSIKILGCLHGLLHHPSLAWSWYKVVVQHVGTDWDRNPFPPCISWLNLVQLFLLLVFSSVVDLLIRVHEVNLLLGTPWAFTSIVTLLSTSSAPDIGSRSRNNLSRFPVLSKIDLYCLQRLLDALHHLL